MKFLFVVIVNLILVFANAQAQGLAESFICRPINFNTKAQEFSPFFIGNKLYFVSNKNNASAINYISNDTVFAHTDIYVSEKIDSINFKSAKKIKSINSLNHDGPITVNKNGKQLVFSSNDKSYKFLIKQANANRKLQLYTSTLLNNKWQKPKPHPLSNIAYSLCHPAFANSDSVLVFCSDMPGGFGKMDLYYSVFKNNSWGKPINFGNKINTPENELFPFVNKLNTLYFSSKSINGNDLDIYEFSLNDSSHTQKKACKSPINSEFDDFGIWTDSIATTGYFSSNRNKNNSDDIFYFEDAVPEFKNCKASKDKFCYTFFEESTKGADTTETIYEWDLGDGTKRRGIEAKHCYYKTGTYQVQLNVIEKASNQLFYNELSYDFVVEDASPLAIKLPELLVKNNAIEFNASKAKIENYTIEKYFWFFSTTEIKQTAIANFTYENRGYKKVTLGVVAKNDSTKQKKNFCIEKSFFISDSVTQLNDLTVAIEKAIPTKINYTTIPKDSITYRVNLGTSKDSISVNSTIFNGVKKLQVVKEDSVYRYTSGAEKTLKETIPYFKFAKQKGFEHAIVVGFSHDSIIKGQTKNANYEIIDTTSVGENKCVVYFEYNNPLVLTKYNEALKIISQKINLNYTKKVTLVNYFDGIGSLEYNIILNNKRIENIVKLLKQYKVNTKNLFVERIYFTGQNVAPDLLRRIEIKIIGNEN